MRIRYAYKMENAQGEVTFVVLNHIKSEEEVLTQFAEKGITKVSFHERVRTGYRLDQDGNLVETGLSRKPADAPAEAPEAAEAPKAKPSKKAKK